MKKLLQILWIITLAATVCGIGFAFTPSGTLISNEAVCTYEDETGKPYKITSNTVTVIVAQICGIEITPDGTAALPGQTLNAMPRSEVAIPYILKNPSNGTDSYSLTPENLSSDDADLSNLMIYIDINQNGILDVGEPPYMNSNPPVLNAGESLYLIVSGKVPDDLSSADIRVNLKGFSNCNSEKQDNENVALVRAVYDASVSGTKTVDKKQVAPGDTLTYRVNFQNDSSTIPVLGVNTHLDKENSGNPKKFRGLLIEDTLPDAVELVLDSFQYSAVNARIFPVYAGHEQVWKTKPEQVSGKILKIGLFIGEDDAGKVLEPSQTGFFEFKARVLWTFTSGKIQNTVLLHYGNKVGDWIFETDETETEVIPADRIIVDDTDDNGVYTGSGVYPDPDDLMVLSHTTDGVWVSFNNEAWNVGTREDAVNLRFDPDMSFNLIASDGTRQKRAVRDGGMTVEFTDMDGVMLPDTDGDGNADTGILQVNESFPFITRVFIPEQAETEKVVIAVQGISKNSPATKDYTYNEIGKIQPVQIKIEIKVKTNIHTQTGVELAKIPLTNHRIIAYQYDLQGRLIDQKIFITDEEGGIQFDESGNESPLYNWMKDGYGYRITLLDEYDGFTYYLTPMFYKEDFDHVKLPGDTYVREEVMVSIMDDGTILLVVPLDPAGYVYDMITGEKVNGACVTFYKCDTPSCDTYQKVDSSVLDVYPDGATQQENPQISGLNQFGNPVGKGTGAFQYKWTKYQPSIDGWYVIDTTFDCGYPGADPNLKDKYTEVRIDKNQIWDPWSGMPYRGGKFYIDLSYPEAIMIRIPLKPADHKALEVTKTVSDSVVSPGDLMKFTVAIKNPNENYSIYDVSVFDNMPSELRYRSGTSKLNGNGIPDPGVSSTGSTLQWNIGTIDANQTVTLTFLAQVAATQAIGKKVNAAFAQGWGDVEKAVPVLSNTGYAWFDLVLGEFTDRAYIIGKVFVDDNDNRIQDENEQGVNGVKIYMEDGRYVVTDSEGKYHMDNIRPGTHILKVDTTSLPPGAVLKPINNRNMDDPGSMFADVFPGDIFKANFRLAPLNLDPNVSIEYQKIEGKVWIKRALTSVPVDPTSGKALLKHSVILENQSEYPLFDVVYEETSPFVPLDGTSYLNGGSFYNPEKKNDGHIWRIQLVAPKETVELEFASELPIGLAEATGNVTFKMDPAEDRTQTLPVQIPITLSMEQLDEYGLTVYFGFGEYILTDDAKRSLDSVVAFLRRKEFKTLYLQVIGHTDSVRVRPERTDYSDNMELSLKRAATVEQYLKNHLIDAEKMKPYVKKENQPQTHGKVASYLNQIVKKERSEKWSIRIGEFLKPEDADKTKKGIETRLAEKGQSNIPIFLREKIIQGKNHTALYVGEFDLEPKAKGFSIKQLGNVYPVEKIQDTEITEVQSPDEKQVVKNEGQGRMTPAVPNQVSPVGTPENRRAEVKVVTYSSQGTEKQVELGTALKRGVYGVRVAIDNTYPLDEMYDATIYVKLPDQINLINGSAQIKGQPISVERKGQFYAASSERMRANEPFEFSFRFLAVSDLKLDSIPCVIIAKTKNGKVVPIPSRDASELDIQSASASYLNVTSPAPLPTEANVQALKSQIRYGIGTPEKDIIQSAKTGNVRIDLPLNASYELTLNGGPIPIDRIGEESKDEKLGVHTLEYIGLEFPKSENKIALRWGENQTDERTITITGKVSDITGSVYPEKPAADGRTPVYMKLTLIDSQGNVIRENAYLEVYADKGDIYDEETNQFKTFMNDQFKARVIGGTAIIKLSPSSTTEDRRITAVYGDIERRIDVRFYPERRPWLIVGGIEGGVGFGKTKNNPPETTDMPYDHHEGDTNMEGRAGVFGKGSIKDYTVTFRYDTQEPDSENTLLQQNTPSTEENQFYPVYGDDSEQYFETQSKEKLFLKVEKELSFLMYGDYQTDLGKDMELNRYSRTFNGGLVNIEESNNYQVKAFVSENKQAILREEIPGRGMSGPYFLKNTELIQFSERVYIQVRDRYNEDIVLSERPLNRFTDYTINYEEGWIIFKEPVRHWDDQLNPIRIRLIYETENLAEDQYMYGVRGEKKFFDGKLSLGAIGVVEEDTEKDKKLYGADITYDNKKNLKIVGEIAQTDNYERTDFGETSGTASRVQANYRFGNSSEVSAYYHNVKDGYQNLSATNADTGYETYGVSGKTSFNDDKTRVTADIGVDDSNGVERTTAETTVSQEITKKIRATAGVRWNDETQDNINGVDEETLLGIVGLTLNPTDRLGISIQRAQSLSGETHSTTYPTKTSARINYRVMDNLDAYVQTELQETAEQDVSVSTVGLDSRLTENTTAFSKYTMDDSTSGWRTQSHVGLNHQFLITQDFTIDAGIENVETVSGADETEDYTAPRLGFTYTQKDQYQISGRAEMRFDDDRNDSLFSLSGVVKLNPNHTLLSSARYFDSDYQEADLFVGWAYRPVPYDQLNFLTKFRWKDRNDSFDTTKYIGSWHVNYNPFSKLAIMGEYAAKFTDVEEDGDTFTDLIRARIIYDITDRFDIGFHAGILNQHDTNTYTLAYGPELGVRVMQNFWMSIGYNFSGFYDKDFDEANYWQQGAYFKFRLKFDENTFKNVYRKLSGKTEEKQ